MCSEPRLPPACPQGGLPGGSPWIQHTGSWRCTTMELCKRVVSGTSPPSIGATGLRRKRPSVAGVLVENNMVARDIHGMIALRDGSEEVRK
jgi:hypothetical protein